MPQRAGADAHPGAVGAAQVLQHPLVAAFGFLAHDLGVGAGHQAIVRNPNVTLGPAKDVAIGPQANPFTILLAVVDDAQQGNRRALQRSFEHRPGVGRRRRLRRAFFWRLPFGCEDGFLNLLVRLHPRDRHFGRRLRRRILIWHGNSFE